MKDGCDFAFKNMTRGVLHERLRVTVCFGRVFALQCKCIDPKNQGKNTCGVTKYKGDGNCDDENNNKGCDYDGGDCCAGTVKGGKVQKDYCKAVGS